MKITLFILLSLSLLTAKVKNGDTLPPLALVDQYEHKVIVTKDNILIFSFQKSVSSEIQAYLATKPKHFLKKNHIIYIADMSSAPRFMIKLFGIPKMKKFDYKVALIYDDAIADKIQREEDKITVIKLNKHRVKKVEFISPKDLEKVLNR